MIRAENLTRTFGPVVAAQEVTFEIGSGEIVGLLGHNGAGKTTIMKMITGCLEPTSGSITINDINVWLNRSSIQRQIGYLPENCPLYPEMTVIDYLDYAAALRGIPESKKLEQIGLAIEKTNLISVLEKSINTISRGYRQRLGVAQAILNSPQILILDEPTNGLDPSQILEMRSLITELAKTATVVVSTHILQEVQAVCSRVIIINSGKVALDANLSDLQVTGRLHVRTNSQPADFSLILAKLENFMVINSQTQQLQYDYTVDVTTQNPSEATALLARTLVEHDCKVFAIQPIVRDLESIFGEITTKGGTASAKENYSRENLLDIKPDVSTSSNMSDENNTTVAASNQKVSQ
jgi:ABC-2 type transport system ATP-binding protein